MNALARASSNFKRQTRPLVREDDHKCLVKEIYGRESQMACCQDALIGGKPVVVK
jgi:hypothetical protein